MKDIKFINSKALLTIEDIQEFETNLEIKLPNNLKNLLLESNGGTIEIDAVYINGEKSDYSFGALYSIKYGLNTIEYSTDMIQITEQLIPREHILFADDQGGNQYTISTEEEDYGKIFIWYMDIGEPEKELVANSLEEFFTGETESN